MNSFYLHAKKLVRRTLNFKMIILCCLLLSATIATNAASWVVLNGDNSSTGSLRDIIGRANDGDVITFGASVKTVTLSGEISTNKMNLTIDGGTGVTITRSTNTSYCRFLNFTATSGTVLLRGITFKNGNLDGKVYLDYDDFTHKLAASGDGGAVKADCNIMALNCTFADNATLGNGGALWTSGAATLTNCDFTANTANIFHDEDIEGNGGAVYAQGNISMANCRFSNNTAIGLTNNESYSDNEIGFDIRNLLIYYGGKGGAFQTNGVATLTDCTFTNNTAGDKGGGAYIVNNADLKNCTFSGNTSVNRGGGINAEKNVELKGCSFINNKTGKLGGGGVWAQNGSANSTDCLFSGNETTGLSLTNEASYLAVNHGGGLSANVGNLNNCIFSKNRAKGHGGGAYLKSDQANSANSGLYNCTFDGNMSGDAGGGFQGFSNMNTPAGIIFNITKCIFTNNNSNAGGAIFSSVGLLRIEYCAFAYNQGKLSIVHSESRSTVTNRGV